MTVSDPGARLPRSIDRYHVLDRLGSGAFATVYLADDPALDTTVAIKVLAANLVDDPGIRSRFVEEARLMRRLATPGLVTVYDIGDHEGQPFVVMELCERGTLDARLARIGRRLDGEETMALARALASCLQPIHGAGVVHRDLKPSNYLIRRRRDARGRAVGRLLAGDEELVVADFGLARVIDVAATRLTMAGGTPGYSAPEQFRGDPSVDATADVYATSAILVAAMTGVSPRPVLTGDDLAFDPTTLAATAPLDQELGRALSPDRGRRHPDIVSWLRALEAAASSPARATGPVQGRAAGPSTDHLAGAGPPLPPATATAHPALPSSASPADAMPSGAMPSSPSPAGASRRMVVIAVAAVAFLVTVAAAVSATGTFSLFDHDGPVVIGPSSGPVDTEAVFAVAGAGASEARWSVNGGAVQAGRLVAVTPSQPGSVTISVTASGATTTVRFEAVAGSAALRIDGPGHVAVGDEPIELRAVGPAGSRYHWMVNGSPADGDVLAITPTGAPGLVNVTLAVDGLSVVERSVTVVPARP